MIVRSNSSGFWEQECPVGRISHRTICQTTFDAFPSPMVSQLKRIKLTDLSDLNSEGFSFYPRIQSADADFQTLLKGGTD